MMLPRATAHVLAASVLALGSSHIAPPAPPDVTAACNRALPDPNTTLSVPGQPFQAVASRDGCWIFVSLIGVDSQPHAIGVIQRQAQQLVLLRTVRVPDGPAGMALSHDGRILVAAAGDTIVFLDVRAMTSGSEGAILGVSVSERAGAGRVYANITADDRVLFVSDERQRSITVVDLGKARASRFTTIPVLGRIPVGTSPIALTFSLDGKWLYTTSQLAPPGLDVPVSCKPQGSADPNAAPDHGMGAVIVVDVARARVRPESSVVSMVPAGCNPVRLALSPSGTTVYVTARGENNVLVFDAERLVNDAEHSRALNIPVGTAPVGVAVIDSGRKIVVTNSNRFAGGADDRQYLTVIDAARVGDGARAVIGRIRAGAFPRELHVTADGRTLLVTNFASRTIQVIDLNRLPMEASGAR